MKHPAKTEPLLIEIEQELMPGRFVRYGDMSDFAGHLHQVEEKNAALIESGETDPAVGLYYDRRQGVEMMTGFNEVLGGLAIGHRATRRLMPELRVL